MAALRKKKPLAVGPVPVAATREPAFQSTGPQHYPGNPTLASPYRNRSYGSLGKQWREEEGGSEAAYESEDTSGVSKAEMRRREMGWSTSFPAEYHRAHQSRDYQQTLAYQEQANQRRRQDEQIATALLSGVPKRVVVAPPPVNPQEAPSPTKEELELQKQVVMREGVLQKLKNLAGAASSTGFQTDTANELLQLLLQLRDASVNVVTAMARWHHSLCFTRGSKPRAYLYQNQNYCAKMISDLNFLATFSSLSRVLGVDPARMKQNPFMMPSPIPDRDFHDVQTHSANAPPRFSFTDPIERVAQAEKYLVWSLVNLPDAVGSTGTSESPPQGGSSSPTSTSATRKELLTWQQRAEKQLRMLSMPLESPSGQAHVMDSSRMMKRKGYLPSLPQSPPKTLTQLMENVHKGGYSSPTKTSCFSAFEVAYEGITYRMTALDVEVLGSNEAPPHAIVTLVAASVLILLSPSDRIPKDLSWASCQKMLSNGLRLVQRVEGVDIAAIPAFKWKALLPFLQNEHYHPMFLMEYSSAAATLCAWVLHVLALAQERDRQETKAEEDQRVLLHELEQEEDEAQRARPDTNSGTGFASALRPVSRPSRGSKRVSIGNAEVLFINENDPVSPPSTAQYGARPTSSGDVGSSSSPSPSPARRHVLLRTSPWTHRGVTYFVSFFLEKDEAASDFLSIKMYEPMSSVESQMFVSADDLQLDFGEHASELFQRRDFGLLCDLILCHLDGMMTPASRGGLQRNDDWQRPSTGQRERAVQPEQSQEDVEAAAVRIQCLARQGHAYKRVAALRGQRDASVRIQCAVRQRHAREKVKHVRFARQQDAATKIQSVARQRQAKQTVAHMRLLERIPTGLPSEEAGGEYEYKQFRMGTSLLTGDHVVEGKFSLC